jgi:hypothetical protein
MPNIDELLEEIWAYRAEDDDYWASPPSQDEPEDDSAFDEQLKEIKALEDADYWDSLPPQGVPEDDPILDELLKEIRAHRRVKDDYWASRHSQDDPEDDPASGAPPEGSGDSDDWPHPAPPKFDDRQLVREFWYLPTGCITLVNRSAPSSRSLRSRIQTLLIRTDSWTKRQWTTRHGDGCCDEWPHGSEGRRCHDGNPLHRSRCKPSPPPHRHTRCKCATTPTRIIHLTITLTGEAAIR